MTTKKLQICPVGREYNQKHTTCRTCYISCNQREIKSRNATITLPLHTTTPGNTRQHWAVDAKKAREQRSTAYLSVKQTAKKIPFPVKVTLTRVSPSKLDQWNLPGAMKHVIDGIADAYGVDDGDDRWKIEFKQRKGKVHAVEVFIEKV